MGRNPPALRSTGVSLPKAGLIITSVGLIGRPLIFSGGSFGESWGDVSTANAVTANDSVNRLRNRAAYRPQLTIFGPEVAFLG